jgi:peptide/nickel transport system ATP-binding protein
MIFQEPMTSLNPVLTIGFQIMEPLLIHLNLTEEAARARAVELLKMVGIPDPERRLDQYPHQFSGGMRQRVMIALDVTIQAQILKLMKDLSRDLGIAMVIITHNLGIVARYANRVNVMYAARLAEQGSAADVFAKPLHPYTAGLLRSVPRLDKPRGLKLETIEGLPPNLLDPQPGCRFAPRCPAQQPACVAVPPPLVQVEPHCRRIRARELSQVGPTGLGLQSANPQPPVHKALDKAQPLLKVHDLKTYFEVGAGLKLFKSAGLEVRAVDGLSFEVFRGETVGLVGESGCGKTTVGRTLLRLEEATGGEMVFEGANVTRRRTAVKDHAARSGISRTLQLVESAHDHGNHRRADAGVPAGARQQGGARQGGGATHPGGAVRVHGGALSARIVRRPAPARGDRARAGDEAVVHRVR